MTRESLNMYFVTVFRCVYVLVTALFLPTSKIRFKKISELLGYQKTETILPQINASRIIDYSQNIELRDFQHRTLYNMTVEELAVLGALVKTNRPKRIFEIGTFDGLATLTMALNADAEYTEISTLDLPPEETSNLARETTIGYRFHNKPYSRMITQLYGNSLSYDFSDHCGKYDFILVDAGHSYENVLHDTQTALSLLKKGQGPILWHDYTLFGEDGVRRAVNELYLKGGKGQTLGQIAGTSFAYLNIPS